jgi:hypothetical protein
MTDFSPKQQFQENEKVSAELAKVVDSENFRIAASAAMAQLAMRCPSHDEMMGARRFLLELMHLPFKDLPLPDFPVRRLDHTVYDKKP